MMLRRLLIEVVRLAWRLLVILHTVRVYIKRAATVRERSCLLNPLRPHREAGGNILLRIRMHIGIAKENLVDVNARFEAERVRLAVLNGPENQTINGF